MTSKIVATLEQDMKKNIRLVRREHIYSLINTHIYMNVNLMYISTFRYTMEERNGEERSEKELLLMLLLSLFLLRERLRTREKKG